MNILFNLFETLHFILSFFKDLKDFKRCDKTQYTNDFECCVWHRR